FFFVCVFFFGVWGGFFCFVCGWFFEKSSCFFCKLGLCNCFSLVDTKPPGQTTATGGLKKR
ncbi:hypothetical protein ACVGV8_00790, partial [Enterobacter intestinihominis]